MKALVLLLTCLLSAAASRARDAAELLDEFRAYRQGGPVALLAATRQAVFRDTGKEEVRAGRERALLAFLAADAQAEAKAIAVEWLGCLGSSASVPALVGARKDPALAAAADAALTRIPGPEAAQARDQRPAVPAAAPKPAVAEVLDLTAALAREATSPQAAERLLAALRSNNQLLRGSALRHVRSGAGGPDFPGKALAALRELPDEIRPLLLEALAARPGDSGILHGFLADAIRSAPRAEQPPAVRAIGRILRPDDVAPLLEIAAREDRDQELADAARAAFARAADPGIDGALVALATAPASPRASLAIAILGDRRSAAAVAPLWSLARGTDPARAREALAGLGESLPPGELPRLLEWLATLPESPLADAGDKALWAVLRRHPDPAAAAAAVEQALPKAPPARQASWGKFAERIRPRAPAPSRTLQLDLPAKDDRAALAPDGFAELACLDCGSTPEIAANGITIRRLKGSPYAFDGHAHPLATIDFGREIAYEITGLAPGAATTIGLSAWDADLGGRRQTIAVDGQILLPAFPPLAYHAGKPTFTRLHLPVPPAAAADGKLTLAVRADAGPNAVLSQLWLLQRKTAPPAAGKRVLVLTGDDFPGHRWRETGPGFAAILRADPRLEVTVSETPYLLGSPVLSAYDAVFLHFKNYAERLPTAEALWRNLDSYVRGGGGLVVAHFGCGALQEWNGFVKLAGRVWDPAKRGHDPYGEFLVRILGSAHPVTMGLADFTTRDELYTCLAGDTAIEALAEATSKADQSVHPMAFVLAPGKGRVFHCPLGHDTRALETAGTRALYLRGTLWAAGIAAD